MVVAQEAAAVDVDLTLSFTIGSSIIVLKTLEVGFPCFFR
jgi:hypothetical protein